MRQEKTAAAKQLDSGFRVTLIIWGAILASLGAYLVVCRLVGPTLPVTTDPGFPIDTIRYALYGITLIILFGVHFLRKIMLKANPQTLNPPPGGSPATRAVARYTVAVVVTSALLECIGIFGVVLFLLSRDTSSLYQLLLISAAAMIHFRPRKEELTNLLANTNANL
jgi:hypothetical protein